MNILIGNLNLMTTATQLSNLFYPFGMVLSSKIITDKTGHSLGYGYITMNSQSGIAAINELNTIKFMNYYIDVSDASA